MSSEDPIIQARGLGKAFALFDRPSDRLRQFVIPRLRRVMGRPSGSYFREFWALRDVNFDIRKGESIGIIGRNGSGKSTLLQLLCGTLTPTMGEVQTQGRIAALLELGSGFNPEFTGRENVFLNGVVLGLTQLEVTERFDRIAAFADIGEFIDRPVKTYSSGMYVRLAFAVAVHVEPEIMVVDEALAVGDIRFQSKCLRRLDEFREQGKVILFVSHSTNTIEGLCDRALWLEGGRLIADGRPAKLVRHYINFMMHDRLPAELLGADAEEPLDAASASSAVPDAAGGLPRSQEGSRPWPWNDLSAARNVVAETGIEILAIRLMADKDANPSHLPSLPRVLRFEVGVSLSRAVPKLMFAIGIFNELNEPVVHCNSFTIDAGLPAVSAGRHVVRGEFELPALRPGQYLVAVGLDEGVPGQSTLLAHVYDAWALTVSPSPDRRVQAGYVQVEQAWMSIEAMSE